MKVKKEESESRVRRGEERRYEVRGKGQRDGSRDEKRMSEEQSKESREREWREKRITCFLTFKKHHLKLLIETAYCLMCREGS